MIRVSKYNLCPSALYLFWSKRLNSPFCTHSNKCRRVDITVWGRNRTRTTETVWQFCMDRKRQWFGLVTHIVNNTESCFNYKRRLFVNLEDYGLVIALVFLLAGYVLLTEENFIERMSRCNNRHIESAIMAGRSSTGGHHPAEGKRKVGQNARLFHIQTNYI